MTGNTKCPECGHQIEFSVTFGAGAVRIGKPDFEQIAKLLDAECLSASMENKKYRGNKILAERYGISIKTAEVWAMQASRYRKYPSPQSKSRRRRKVTVTA